MAKKKEREYPKPDGSGTVPCLGCNKGKVLHGNQIRNCRLCNGTGRVKA